MTKDSAIHADHVGNQALPAPDSVTGRPSDNKAHKQSQRSMRQV